MSEKLVIDKSTLTDIADSIRAKSGSSDLILVSALAQAISDLPSGGGSTESGEITPINTSNTIDIETELSEVHFVIIIRKTVSNMANGDIVLLLATDNGGYAKDDTYYYGVSVRSNWGNVGTSNASSVSFEVDDGIVTINTSNFSGANNFTKGVTYQYYLF